MQLSRLSRALYAEFLDAATGRGLAFVRFADFLPDGTLPSGRYAALRHDVDFAPEHSVAMAEMEHAAGVTATYFVLADGHFYNPLSPENVRHVRRIAALGHEIGLHFAVSDAVHDDLGEEVAFRLALLEDIAGIAVRSFSQHDPVNAGFAEVALPAGHPPCVDAYRAARDHDLLYVSESAMLWREHTFATALEQSDRNLCLAAHSHSWLHPGDDYVAMLQGFRDAEVERLGGRYDAFTAALPAYYERRAAGA